MLLNLSPDVLALNPELADLVKGRKVRARSNGKSEAAPPVAPETRVQARLDEPGRPDFASRLEERAWYEWVPTQQPALALYEPLTLRLDGGRYTPDIGLVMPTGEFWLVEVKGDWDAHQSGRSSKRNLRQASIEFAWLARFFALMPGDGLDWNFFEVVQGHFPGEST